MLNILIAYWNKYHKGIKLFLKIKFILKIVIYILIAICDVSKTPDLVMNLFGFFLTDDNFDIESDNSIDNKTDDDETGDNKTGKPMCRPFAADLIYKLWTMVSESPNINITIRKEVFLFILAAFLAVWYAVFGNVSSEDFEILRSLWMDTVSAAGIEPNENDIFYILLHSNADLRDMDEAAFMQIIVDNFIEAPFEDPDGVLDKPIAPIIGPNDLEYMRIGYEIKQSYFKNLAVKNFFYISTYLHGFWYVGNYVKNIFTSRNDEDDSAGSDEDLFE